MEAAAAKTAASAESVGLSGDGPSPDGGADWTVLTDGDEKKKEKSGGGKEKVPTDAATSSEATTAQSKTEADATSSQAHADKGSDLDSDSDSDYLDMEAFEEENLVQPDAAAVPAAVSGGVGGSATGGAGVGGTGSSNIEKVRTYDLSISYDNYYKTPRVWMFGFDEHGSPLEPEQIFEDIAVDYRKRTVTIDPYVIDLPAPSACQRVLF